MTLGVEPRIRAWAGEWSRRPGPPAGSGSPRRGRPLGPVYLFLVPLVLVPALALEPAPPAGGIARLASAAGVAEIDLAAPGGAVIALAPVGGADVLAAADARGLGLAIEGVAIPDAAWEPTEWAVRRRADGAAVLDAVWQTPVEAGGIRALAVRRAFTLRADAATLIVETRLEPDVPLYVTSYRLLAVVASPTLAGASIVAHDYNGGADWNEEFHRAADARPPFEGRAELAHV